MYASSGRNIQPPTRTRNHLRQEQPIPVFYFGVGIAVKKRCEKDGVAYLNLEAVARGLGFTTVATSGNAVVRWERVEGYLKELGVPTCGHDDYIPENIFYRLACAACADANASLMGVQGVRLRFFFQILCGIAGGIASADARAKCAHTSSREKASLYADFGQGQGNSSKAIRKLDADE